MDRSKTGGQAANMPPVTTGMPADAWRWFVALRKSRTRGASALGTAAVLASYADPDGSHIFPGAATLQLDLGLCDRQVRAHVTGLAVDGWLARERGRGLGRGKGRAPDMWALLIPAAFTTGSLPFTTGSQVPPVSVTTGSRTPVTTGSQSESHPSFTYDIKKTSPPAAQRAVTGGSQLAVRGGDDLDSRGIHARLAEACPELSGDEIEAVIARLRANPKISSPVSVLMARIADGTIRDYVADHVVKIRQEAATVAVLRDGNAHREAERQRQREAREAERAEAARHCCHWKCTAPPAWWQAHPGNTDYPGKAFCEAHAAEHRKDSAEGEARDAKYHLAPNPLPPLVPYAERSRCGACGGPLEFAVTDPAELAEAAQGAYVCEACWERQREAGAQFPEPRDNRTEVADQDKPAPVTRLAQCPWCGATAKRGSSHPSHRDGSACQGLAA